MTAIGTVFLILAAITALIFSVTVGVILAHLVLYRRRGQAAKSKKDRGGDKKHLIDLIRYD